MQATWQAPSRGWDDDGLPEVWVDVPEDMSIGQVVAEEGDRHGIPYEGLCAESLGVEWGSLSAEAQQAFKVKVWQQANRGKQRLRRGQRLIVPGGMERWMEAW
jgi:hypothetical protein